MDSAILRIGNYIQLLADNNELYASKEHDKLSHEEAKSRILNTEVIIATILHELCNEIDVNHIEISCKTKEGFVPNVKIKASKVIEYD